jgi:hypothetical protein
MRDKGRATIKVRPYRDKERATIKVAPTRIKRGQP